MTTSLYSRAASRLKSTTRTVYPTERAALNALKELLRKIAPNLAESSDFISTLSYAPQWRILGAELTYRLPNKGASLMTINRTTKEYALLYPF